MGYLDNSSVTVDAVLTKKGRELLAKGQFNITKFALGDDEVNYALYDTSHNLGSAYYGEAIERMPVLEAFTNDTQTLKYQLVTLPKNTQILPVIQVPMTSVTLDTSQTITISPTTKNVTNGNTTSGYSFTIGNTDIVEMTSLGSNYNQSSATAAHGPAATGQALQGTVISSGVQLKGLSLVTATTTTLTVIGNDTGGSVTIPITINRDTALD